ncbi:unnamed protein product, partial [Mesorhabditis belari]|uniref:Uncharacterized protein n=1 Tax=Mesorhabditis belari TaxID=2138241 RepID=A0AAF3J453_9BILA
MHQFLGETSAELIFDRDDYIQPPRDDDNTNLELNGDGLAEKFEFYLKSKNVSKFDQVSVILQGFLPVFRLRAGEFEAFAEKLKNGILAFGLEEITDESPDSLKLCQSFAEVTQKYSTIPILEFSTRTGALEDWKFPENDQTTWFMRRKMLEKDRICMVSVNEEDQQSIVQIQLLMKDFDKNDAKNG